MRVAATLCCEDGPVDDTERQPTRNAAASTPPRLKRHFVRASVVIIPLVVLIIILGGLGVFSRHSSSSPAAGSTYPILSDEVANTPFSLNQSIRGPFLASKLDGHACAFIGSTVIVVPSSSGYKVRFSPTQLLDSSGKVVASEGQTITTTGTAETPGSSSMGCGPAGGSVFAAQSALVLVPGG